MKHDLKIVVLIPCLNEEKTISNVILDFKKKIPGSTIHVFDNSSSDNSKKIAQDAGAIIHNIEYKGKGNVVRRMFADVDGDIFIMIDADDTYDTKNINKMINTLLSNDLDMLVARRNSVEEKAYRFGHILGNKLFSYLVKIIFGNQIDDLFSGFRIFTRRFIKSFPGNSHGFEIETELTIHALEQRLAVGEMDCNYKSRPSGSSSKLNTIQDGFKILKVILVLIKDERPLFFFSSFALFFFLFSLILGIPIIFSFMETGLVAKMPSAILAAVNMVIAFLSFFSGLILDVIKKSRHERKRLNYLTMKK